ncbi:MAG: thiamine-phosphate kinase [Candidatus Omnitrophica bacterium]|nr:thiamine-phosphate kinase [Candidatus Omnitrophota bacterium]
MKRRITVEDIGEFGLINYLRKTIKYNKSVVKGIGEDAAVINYSKTKYLLFTTDMLIENVHFKIKESSPYQIGWKALGCSLSDIASMGGIPLYALISLGVPKNLSFDFIKGIYLGIRKLANIFKVNIVGGDTDRADKLIVDVFLVGEVEKKRVVYRSGAKVNDIIAVTGSLGNSYKIKKHLKFLPRIKEARFLVNNFRINSMIDISDGLSADLFHVLRESKKGAIIFDKKLPLARKATIEQALNEGEDFELLFTLSEKEAIRLSKNKKIAVSFIGKVTEDSGKIIFYSRKGIINGIRPKGFRHF